MDGRFDFKVVNCKENPDGSASFEFEYSNEFAKFYKETTGEEVDEEGFQEFMTKALEQLQKGKSNIIPMKKVFDPPESKS